jgi:hypothetical protein
LATDATGTPTTLSIPTFNVDVDSPSGAGSNAIVEAIDDLIVADRVRLAALEAADNPSLLTATGDIMYASAANTPARLAVGSTGNVLTVAGGVPTWAAPSTSDLVTNAQTGTTYTLVLTDKNKLVELSNAAAITLTVPPNSSVAFAVGDMIQILQTAAGQVTVAPGAGVTLNGNPGLKTNGQWSAATLVKRATDTWVLFGNITT